ncbi:hypothetical protein ACFQ7N_39750 [Streptomyces niveus]|uniref:hypothetical protein n=1 Tax=Streptomyces niveus TaxID=193462 RepID=UPI0036801110
MNTRLSTTIACTRCKTIAELPENRDHSALWDAGWRWIGSANLFSCPGCPPLLIVDGQGQHVRGPGLLPS